MRKIFFESKDCPSRNEIQIMIKAAPSIEPELVTVVRMADEAGIPAGITRRLRWDDIDGDIALLKHHNAKVIIRRRLPKSLVIYLRSLPRSGPFLCPKLHSMKGNIGNLYKKLWATINSKVSTTSLVWNYRQEHKKEQKMEEIIAHLERFAREFTTEAEFIAIQLAMEGWRRLPPLRQLGRRRTREEILGCL